MTNYMYIINQDERCDNSPAHTISVQSLMTSLPSFIRDQQSLAAFRQQLKTVLFRTSFGEDANT